MKKVLAWAVVLALVFSSFTMAFAADKKAASDFSDYDSIQYKEAVDVMVATGVINGYPDGTFGPTKDVKRSESAKMIAVMLNGGKDIGDEYKGSCTFADSKNHWAAGYIAYCAATQPVIINGRSADVFDPEGSVTGTELAKMALCALGYDPQIQGYTGDQWSASVLRDANKVGLFEGLADDFVPGEPCSREETAQILFNALKGTMVEYDTTTSVTVGDATVTVNSKVQDQKWPNSDSPFYPMRPDPKDDNRDGLKQLYESVFDGKLGQTGTDEDESGRPAHEWEFDDESIGIYADAPDYDFFAEDGTSVAKAVKAYDESLYKDFTKNKNTKALEDIYVNGEWYDADFDDPTEDDYNEIVVAKGDRVELFKLGTDNGVDYYRAVVTQYIPVKITGVETDLDEEDIEDGHSAQISWTEFWQYHGIFEYADEYYDDEITGYDADTYVEDAVLALAFSYDDDTILDSYVMEEAANGTVTKVKGTNITIDGEVYVLNENYAPVDREQIRSKADFILYDYNGFVLASEKAAEEDNTQYGILLGTLNEKDKWDPEKILSEVKIFTSEGDESDIKVSSDYTNYPYKETSIWNGDRLVAYEVNEDGELTFIKECATVQQTGKNMKNGILYGKKVLDEVVAFANTADPGDDAAKWTVYDYEDLEAADEITVSAWELTKDGIAAMKIGSLEPVNTVLGFATKVEPTQNEDGDWVWDVTAFVDGKEVSYTTKKGVVVPEFRGAALLKFTVDGNIAKAVELADCIGVDDVSTAFDKADATFYGAGKFAVAENNIYLVKEKNGDQLDVGPNALVPEGIDYQIVSQNANVYSFTFGEEGPEFAASSFKNVKAGCAVILMKLDEESEVWDTVIYTTGLPH